MDKIVYFPLESPDFDTCGATSRSQCDLALVHTDGTVTPSFCALEQWTTNGRPVAPCALP
jgi:hypothetical protein